MTLIELIVLFFIVATVYASAGFGGGSSYLAVMALFGIPMTTMKSTALLCNLIVVIGGAYIFWKNGFLNFKKILPLSIASVPFAFWGGMRKLDEKTFFLLLGTCLIIAAILMFFQNSLHNTTPRSTRYALPLSVGFGSSIGFLSGVVGIGGGVFLSPLLNLLKWDTPKHIAATASFFILINSVAGLAGQLYQNKLVLNWSFALPLMAAVLVGGQLGSRVSALKFDQLLVRRATAVLVFYAGANVLWSHF